MNGNRESEIEFTWLRAERLRLCCLIIWHLEWAGCIVIGKCSMFPIVTRLIDSFQQQRRGKVHCYYKVRVLLVTVIEESESVQGLEICWINKGETERHLLVKMSQWCRPVKMKLLLLSLFCLTQIISWAESSGGGEEAHHLVKRTSKHHGLGVGSSCTVKGSYCSCHYCRSASTPQVFLIHF